MHAAAAACSRCLCTLASKNYYLKPPGQNLEVQTHIYHCRAVANLRIIVCIYCYSHWICECQRSKADACTSRRRGSPAPGSKGWLSGQQSCGDYSYSAYYSRQGMSVRCVILVATWTPIHCDVHVCVNCNCSALSCTPTNTSLLPTGSMQSCKRPREPNIIRCSPEAPCKWQPGQHIGKGCIGEKVHTSGGLC